MQMYGKAHIANLVFDVTWASLGSNSVPLASSVEYKHEWDTKVELLSPSTGEVIGRGITKKRRTITLELIPCGGTSTNNTKAVAAGALKEPAPYAVITVTNCRNSDYNGSYNYVGGWSVTETPDGMAKCRLVGEQLLASESAPATLAAEVTT